MQTKSKGKILIVDDEEPMLGLLHEILSENGYSCNTANCVQEAKKSLERQAFDLVLSDIRMPGESGLDLCRYIKFTHPDVAVMLVTAVDDMETAGEAIALDIYGYILKPITISQLLISVANAFRRHELERLEKGMRGRLEEMVCEKTAVI